MSTKTLKKIIGLLGLSGIALGAFGAHALKTQLALGGHTTTWEKAVFYHLFHTVALFALAVQIEASSPSKKKDQLASLTTGFWLCGILLFSGSLYGLSLDGPRWLGPITPLGGLAFLSGWGCVFASGFSSTASTKN